MSASAALPPLRGLTFTDLETPAGLARLDEQFRKWLAAEAPELAARLADYRDPGRKWDALAVSEFLLALAPRLEAFLVECFSIHQEAAALARATRQENQVLEFRKQFVLRRVRRFRGEVAETFAELDAWLSGQIGAPGDRELAVAEFGLGLLEHPGAHAGDIDRLTRWCVLARRDPAGQAAVRDWVAFRLPQPVHPDALVSLEPVPDDPAGRLRAAPGRWRRRDGFALTDPRMTRRRALGEVHYCIYCHDHDGDFCSKGFPVKKGDPSLGFKTNALGVTLTGCPLEEKISEMHVLKRDGRALAALAVAMVDNPMVPATGHRICNDCMKACIYQKQEPVNIPQTETRILTDVLDLPWGVEIYHLLVRWNPLRRRQYLMQPDNGRRVLVAGLGPAGFTMAHHLTMAGCTVVGIDGLKIEPLPDEILHAPVRDYRTLQEDLDERILGGFGGVAEYGITVRWDKNFLKLIYLTLARRPGFAARGGVRLGGTLTLEDAFAEGFDHVCIATGAGLPRVIPMENSLARGMRQANDFLMALQLTGAAKADSLANLQVRLPAVVIGGGLTAVDTATEVQAYYIKQVEKILHRYEVLAAAHGEDFVRSRLDEENRKLLDEYLAHGRAVRAERERARAAGEAPDFLPLLHAWGGVTLAYRRGLRDSPAYQRNHEEVAKALEEGIFYVEGLEPRGLELDEYGHVAAVTFHRRRRRDAGWEDTGELVRLPARAVFAAAGAFPNTIYEREYPGTFRLQDDHYQPHAVRDGRLVPVPVAGHCKADPFGPFTSYAADRHRVTFIGDTHPVFHGSVVKAIASAARSYPAVLAALEGSPAASREPPGAFIERITDGLTPRVVQVDTSHPAVVALRVRAPFAARNFKPGQFFRLQTFERLSPVQHETRLQIPLQTVSGAGVEGDHIRLVLLRMGANARLAERLEPGQPVILMGPTGAPAEIERNKTVLVVAGSWGAAVMLDLGPALRAAGNRVLFVGAFTSAEQLYHREELEAGCNQIVWVSQSEPLIPARRPRDLSVQGSDVIAVLDEYGTGRLGVDGGIPLPEVDEVLVMGSTGLLRGLQDALRGRLAGHFQSDVKVLGTVGSPMQCMLKGVCGQCLQWQIDPATGERTRAVFSCAQQDQPLFAIDLDNLAARQSQNRLAETLTQIWVDHLLNPS